LRQINKKAFTLIEVMIALMILSFTLLALSQSQAVALNSTRKSRLLTLATIAAKNMMTDIELMADVKGFQYIKDMGEKEEGTFDKGIYKGWKWTKEVKEVTFPLSKIINMIMGQEDLSSESGESGYLDSDEPALGSGMEGQLMNMISSNIEKLMKDSMREITVTVLWPVRGGKEFSNMKIVYYVVDYEAVEKFVPSI
jgi:prepilin-type N-terminal cleavage/methylation domain-containing protein